MAKAATRDIAARVIDASLGLAAERGWQGVTLGEIARAADVSLAELHAHFPSKPAILAGFVRRIESQVLAGEMPFDAGDTPRDRLFEAMMRCFDALGDHRAAIRHFLRDLPLDPLGALMLAPTVLLSMGWTLEAAGISSAGPIGALRAKGLLMIWLMTLRVWLDDDGADLSPTMAALDRNLARAERLAHLLQPGRRVPEPEPESAPAAQSATKPKAKAKAKPKAKKPAAKGKSKGRSTARKRRT